MNKGTMNAAVTGLVKENKKLKRVIGSYGNTRAAESIVTQNRFNIFNDENEMNWNDFVQQTDGCASKKKVILKPPPIKITDEKMNIHDVKTFLNDI